MNYKDYNDYELVNYVRESNEEANNILYEKYKPIISKSAKRLFKYCSYNGLELSDLEQEGMLGLSKAIDTFDDSKEASFYTYAKTCIERKQISLIIANQRLKHKVLNESVPFEAYDDTDEIKTIDAWLVDNSYNPENIVFEEEKLNEFKKKVKDTLTDFEMQVFELKAAGFSYSEISEILDKDKKQIDNAIQRLKIKLKKVV